MDYDSLVKGCDASHWNGAISWLQLAADGVQFGYVKATQGHGSDPLFRTNFAGAETAGIIVLPYVFLTPDDDDTTVAYFRQVVGRDDIPAVLDREPPSAIPVDVVEMWINGLARKPMVYQGLSDDVTPLVASCPRILPEYAPEPKLRPWDGIGEPDGSKEWVIWQRSEKGAFQGETGNFDLDVLAISIDQFKTWYLTGSWSAAASS